MSGLRSQSDVVIDTSDLNIHQLAVAVADQFGGESGAALRLTLLTFGFKYGLPSDADMVADPWPHGTGGGCLAREPLEERAEASRVSSPLELLHDVVDGCR